MKIARCMVDARKETRKPARTRVACHATRESYSRELLAPSCKSLPEQEVELVGVVPDGVDRVPGGKMLGAAVGRQMLRVIDAVRLSGRNVTTADGGVGHVQGKAWLPFLCRGGSQRG